MLVIRKTQMDIFKREAMRRFEKDMAVYLKRYFPEESLALDHNMMLEHIRHIITAAETYGLSAERDLYKYLNLSMIYGKNFDERPDLKWMTDTLLNRDIPNPSKRMNKLYKKVLENLKPQEPENNSEHPGNMKKMKRESDV